MNLVDTIRAYLKGEKLNNESFDERLLNHAITQSLDTILYPVYGIKEYKKYYVSWVLKQEKYYDLDKEITTLFNKNHINHIYFKGTVLSTLYDDPSIRTRGDIDFYVSKDDMTLAHKLLLDNGFIDDESCQDCMHHIGIRKNNIEVELHFVMFDPDNLDSWKNMFKDPFSKCSIKDGYLYEFLPTYHFLYCMMHFAHHLRSGAGIRYILDFYYMLKKTNIDMDLLHKEIKNCQLETLYSNIINAIRYLSYTDFDSSVENIDIEFFIDYMLSYGIHGYSNNETTKQAVHQNKVRYFFSRVFVWNKAYRISLYPKMGKKAICYPLCVIHHFFYLITHKLKSFFLFLFGKNKNKELYKKLGV
ncbi:putative nucleotidyltransferase-like protein [Anaeroplasma bactoclasticum]|uniref:Putative nucleotidyltransferase-like protein n=1 Tax=Anaeroplasma bactoclasticum TaxID=2088 RepID=A0A397RMS4_9MOLU|nr:nucleotidyltransferase family protein [Anaeroplasma bactoclasticum]RIA75630.1 putative nucleotidyltransferase-like protein [Anaeroplasma bactoclasticum]